MESSSSAVLEVFISILDFLVRNGNYFRLVHGKTANSITAPATSIKASKDHVAITYIGHLTFCFTSTLLFGTTVTMPSKFVFNSLGLSRNAVQLASLVPNFRYPQQDALTAITVMEDTDFHVHSQQNFTGLLQTSKGSLFRTNLTRLISASYDATEHSSILLSAYEGKVYELKSPTSLFEQLCTLPEVRKWLQNRFRRNRKCYFIVGLRTFFDARILKRDQNASKISSNVEVPVMNLVSPGVGEVISDVGITGRHSTTHGDKEGFDAAGEQIYAFCYREVTFKFFDRENVDAATLRSDNCWIPTLGKRGNDKVDDEVVEASLKDIDEGEGKFKKFTTEDGQEEYFFPSDQ
jgi:hypothetical protein